MMLQHFRASLMLASLLFISGCGSSDEANGTSDTPSGAIRSDGGGAPNSNAKSDEAEAIEKVNLAHGGVELGPDGSATSVFMNNPNAFDLSAVSGLKKVESIYANNSKVSDLSPLSELTNLKKLIIGSTQVVDLTPLAGLTNLEVLDFSNTDVKDITPLLKLSKLKRITASRTKVSEEQFEKLKAAFPNCKIYD